MSLKNKVCEHTRLHGTVRVAKGRADEAICSKCMEKIFKVDGTWYNKQETSVINALLSI